MTKPFRQPQDLGFFDPRHQEGKLIPTQTGQQIFFAYLGLQLVCGLYSQFS